MEELYRVVRPELFTQSHSGEGEGEGEGEER